MAPRFWGQWYPHPSPAGLWMVAVFSVRKPDGVTEVAVKAKDGTVTPVMVDGTTASVVGDAVWACPTYERMSIRQVPACPQCGEPSRAPAMSGGQRHVCVGRPQPPTDDPDLGDDTLF